VDLANYLKKITFVTMMRLMLPVLLSSMPFGLVNAEFDSDLDSKNRDEAEALEIKAKDFWQGLMDSAQGLEATRNAELSAKIELSLKSLPSEDSDSREAFRRIATLFNKAVGHLATADSMLFEEASRSKMLALQQLETGGSREALRSFVLDWEGHLKTASTRFVGHGTYEKKLARNILTRLKEMDPALSRAAKMGPEMYEESEQASKSARAVLRNEDLPDVLQNLARDIITATAKQRVRFENYLLGSLVTTAQDLASQNDDATQTVIKSRLRGASGASRPAKPVSQVKQRNAEEKKMDAEAPLKFSDGLPVDAKPITITVF